MGKGAGGDEWEGEVLEAIAYWLRRCERESLDGVDEMLNFIDRDFLGVE